MESIPKDQIYECHKDTVQYLRRKYNLDTPERLDEAVTIILSWLKKQDHIVKKEYSKESIERMIINNKGSVEKTKSKLDKIAALRTFLPHFFVPINDVAKLSILDEMITVILPKLTKEHYRVYLLKSLINHHRNNFMEYFRYVLMICEYSQAHDYCIGLILLFDFSETNILELIKSLNFLELHHLIKIITDGYGMSIKGIHIISPSKGVDTLITLVKQAVSKKIGDRIRNHKNVEDLYTFVPKEIMPSDFGGQAKSMSEISNNWKAVLGSKHVMEYLREMQYACTNENFRRDDKSNEEYLGMSGSFRNLSVD